MNSLLENTENDFLYDYVFLEGNLPSSEDDFTLWAPEICDIFRENLKAGSAPILAPEAPAAVLTQNESLSTVLLPSFALQDVLTGGVHLQDAKITRSSSNPNATSLRSSGTETRFRACWRCKILKKKVRVCQTALYQYSNLFIVQLRKPMQELPSTRFHCQG
jgi:hypothetical protein